MLGIKPTVKLDNDLSSMRYPLIHQYGSQTDETGLHELLQNEKRSGMELPEAVK